MVIPLLWVDVGVCSLCAILLSNNKQLACIIHEFKKFVNKHLQTKKNLRAGFDRVLRTQLKASPERRPEKAEVEVRRTNRS
jgi:hypothetical protein